MPISCGTVPNAMVSLKESRISNGSTATKMSNRYSIKKDNGLVPKGGSIVRDKRRLTIPNKGLR